MHSARAAIGRRVLLDTTAMTIAKEADRHAAAGAGEETVPPQSRGSRAR